MVRREKVMDAHGRQWVSGALDSDTYFAEVRRDARERARREVAARLDMVTKPRKRHLAGR
jgi:hypothetical protein